MAINVDWIAEAVPKAEVLRLIYQGRFLHCNVTLGALSLPLGKTTVMHLVPRDNLPEPNSQGKREKYSMHIHGSKVVTFQKRTNKSDIVHARLKK